MKIRLLTLLIVCLSLHTTKAFAHPKPDRMSDAEHAEYHHEELRKVNEEINNRLDRAENDIKKLKNQGQSTSNRVTKIEGQRKGEKKIKDAQTNSLFTFVTIVIIVAICRLPTGPTVKTEISKPKGDRAPIMTDPWTRILIGGAC